MFTYAVLSEVGEREINEDSVGFAPVGKDIGMVILADGLGGHGRGEDASALVTTASKEVFRYYYNQKDCLERCFTVMCSGAMSVIPDYIILKMEKS